MYNCNSIFWPLSWVHIQKLDPKWDAVCIPMLLVGNIGMCMVWEKTKSLVILTAKALREAACWNPFTTLKEAGLWLEKNENLHSLKHGCILNCYTRSRDQFRCVVEVVLNTSMRTALQLLRLQTQYPRPSPLTSKPHNRNIFIIKTLEFFRTCQLKTQQQSELTPRQHHIQRLWMHQKLDILQIPHSNWRVAQSSCNTKIFSMSKQT